MSKALKSPRNAYRALQPGDPAPRFRQHSTARTDHSLDSIAGRYLLLGFVGTASDETGRAALDRVRNLSALFDDAHLAFFGVTADPADMDRAKTETPDLRWFWDVDCSVSRLYGSAPLEQDGDQVRLRRQWLLLDPMLRIHAVIPFEPDGSDGPQLEALLKGLPPLDRWTGIEMQAPILYLPRVLEPEVCAQLIAVYEDKGGELSGFMAERDGKTVLMEDPLHKRRRDVLLEDQKLIALTQDRVRRRIVPEIERAYQFRATRMERYLVACYSDDEAGHFRAHRDNTTKGTAHRRFAVSINLSNDFKGGEIGFPEFGPRTYKPPVGGAVVFSCSLLHQVSPVTRGRRYAFLPFLYDDAAAKIREANNVFLGDGTSAYKA